MGIRIVRKNSNGAPALVQTPPVKMINLKHDDCRWPIDTDSGYLFCGAQTYDKVYCPHHHHRAIQHKKLKPLEAMLGKIL